MTSPPLDSTRSRQRRVWHDITVVGQHTRSNDVECDMTSPPLDSTHGQMTSGVACRHRPWTAHTVEQRPAWPDITAFGQHTRSNNVWCGFISTPLDCTHGWTTSCVASHHRPWTARTVRRCRAWHAIIAFGLHKRSNNVGRGMKSPPLDCKHGRQCRSWHDITSLGKHTRSDNVGRGMTSPPVDCKHGQTMSGVA